MRERERFTSIGRRPSNRSPSGLTYSMKRERERESQLTGRVWKRRVLGVFLVFVKNPLRWPLLHVAVQVTVPNGMNRTDPFTLLIKRYFSGTVGHQINVTRLSMHISLLPKMRSGCFFCIEDKLEKRKKKKKNVSNCHLAER